MRAIKKKAYATKKHQESEIVNMANSVTAYISAKARVIYTTLAVLAALLILAGGYSLKRSLNEQKAAPLLAAAQEVYTPGGGPGADYAKALEMFRSVHEKYPSTRSGAIASYYAANTLMQLGRNEEALKAYQAFVSEYGDQEFLAGLVRQRMGYLYREMGNEGEAIRAFEQSEKRLGPGMATMELARLYDKAGKPDEARKKYQVIAKNLGGTSLAAEAAAKTGQTADSVSPPADKAAGK